MNINDFAVKVCETEGMKKQVNVAQVKEILKVINKLTCGIFYLLVRLLPLRKEK